MVDAKKIPQHIAIILDGNGRWAKQHRLPRVKGHMEGVKRVLEIVEAAHNKGVKVLTLFAFSTENWSRPKREVAALMNILLNLLKNELKNLQKNNIRFSVIGRRENIPGSVLKTIDKTIEETKNNTGLIMNLAFNYGGRQEITDALKAIVREANEGVLDAQDINEETISEHLYTKELPDPDLLIRTSGEQRISNFLLWQASYCEFYFTDIYWPDFKEKELDKAIAVFQGRERRFGALTS